MLSSPVQTPDTGGGPLAGITVLDLTRVVSGPYCTMLLADMGARVIKIEQPGKGDDTRRWGPPFQNGESSYFLSINRNKESVALDFKDVEGRRILDRLIERTDVLVENFRPGKLAKLGLDYSTLSARQPGLVYCSISGFGQTGRRAFEAGYDAVAQAEGGFMSVTGTAGGPPIRPGIPIADLASGMFAAFGIVLGLFARDRTGRGQSVDIGMLDAVVAMLTYQAASYFATGDVPQRLGNRHPIVAPYETFTASDGDFVLAVANEELWRRFCHATDLGHLAEDERFSTNDGRVRRYDELKPLLADRLRMETRQHWTDRLTRVGVPSGSVRGLDEVFADPHLIDREMVLDGHHPMAGLLRLVGVPLKLSDTPGSVRTMPPMLGQHTESVLAKDLGLNAQEVETLRRRGVVQGPSATAACR